MTSEVDRLKGLLNDTSTDDTSSDNGRSYFVISDGGSSSSEIPQDRPDKIDSLKVFIGRLNDIYKRLNELAYRRAKNLESPEEHNNLYNSIVKDVVELVKKTDIKGKGSRQWYKALVIDGNAAINQSMRKPYKINPTKFHILINDIIPAFKDNTRAQIISTISKIKPLNDNFVQLKSDYERAKNIFDDGYLADGLKAIDSSKLKDDVLPYGRVLDKLEKPTEEAQPQQPTEEAQPQQPTEEAQPKVVSSADQGEEDINEVEPVGEVTEIPTVNVDSLMKTPGAYDERAPISDVESDFAYTLLDSASKGKDLNIVYDDETYRITNEATVNAINETGMPEVIQEIKNKQDQSQNTIKKFRKKLMEAIYKIFKDNIRVADIRERYREMRKLDVPRPTFSSIYTIGRLDRDAHRQRDTLRVNPLIFKHSN